jgi:hypothetical protein
MAVNATSSTLAVLATALRGRTKISPVALQQHRPMQLVRMNARPLPQREALPLQSQQVSPRQRYAFSPTWSSLPLQAV